MARAVGLRFAAGVIGVGAGAVTSVFGVLMVLFGGVLAAVSSTSGSLAGSGALLVGFSLLAILISAGFFFMPWPKVGALSLGVLTAFILWAFARVGATGVSMLVVIPFCAAVLCGLVSDGAPEEPPSER